MDEIRETIFVILMGLFVILGIAGSGAFFLGKNTAFKKKYFPWYVISIGVLFGLSMIVTGMDFIGLIIFIPAIAFITYINLRTIKFCDSCGKTIVNRAWFSKVNYCSNCGAKLND
jgi:hypothetical protein